MRTLWATVVSLALGIIVVGQSDLQKVVETERAFARFAAEKGTKPAFLEYTAKDGVLFLPDKVKAMDYWNARGESKGLLSWDPNYADISSNGMFGYTTGNWEYRSAGKGGIPEGFGEFITIWRREPDGKYRFVVDIGISHAKPSAYSTALAVPAHPSSVNEKNMSAADSANGFFEIVGRNGLRSGYEDFAAKDIRAFRENEMPLIGKKELLSHIKRTKGKTILTKRSVFVQASDIAYVVSTYSRINEDGSNEKGNFVQIWKLIDNRWQIVLDIFKPVPASNG
ncbi:MAG TPA: hypothetical protein VJL58_00740 [Pyrinomonadaceae bacterium]|nr:hypothetical protein [Pyrinomonadaceae bacterium]